MMVPFGKGSVIHQISYAKPNKRFFFHEVEQMYFPRVDVSVESCIFLAGPIVGRLGIFAIYVAFS